MTNRISRPQRSWVCSRLNFRTFPDSPKFPMHPVLIEKMIGKLWEAKNPVVFAGDGVHWSRAGQNLIEFAELARIPVCGRRIGRGAIPGLHPLHFSSRIHRKVLADCDLMVISISLQSTPNACCDTTIRNRVRVIWYFMT